MSGRSAKVRNTNKKDAIAHLKAQGGLPVRTELQRRQEANEFDIHARQLAGGSLLSRESFLPLQPTARYPASHVAPSPSNFREPSIDSIEFLVQQARMVRRPETSNIESTIEKSAIRVALDSQSDQIRNTLTGLFAGKKKAKDEQGLFIRPPMNKAQRELQAELEAAEAAMAIRPAVSLRSEPASGPPTTPLPPTPPKVPELQQWIPRERHSNIWKEGTFDSEMWKKDGDILVFLQCENMDTKKPKGRPSFCLHEKVLRECKSLVLISLIDEHRRNRESVAKPPATSEYFHTPENYPAAQEEPKTNIESYICLPPDGCSTDAEKVAFNWGTRNALSLLYKGSLIGMTAYETLDMSQRRLNDFFGEPEPGNKIIIDYCVDTKFFDPRYDLGKAASLLAFAEGDDIHWEKGYLDGFVHCCGMYNYLQHVPEFKFVKPATKALLQRYDLDLQHRIQQAERRLATFDFDDMWILREGDSRMGLEAFERTRAFFVGFYTHKYGVWPTPKADKDSKTWLSRSQVRDMQADFNSLYDYYVDRSVWFEEQATQFTDMAPCWRMIRVNDRDFYPNVDGIRMFEMLRRFDSSNSYHPIPAPFPVLPQSIPVTEVSSTPTTEKPEKSEKKSGGLFKKKKKSKEDETPTEKKIVDPLKENEFRLIYSPANNLLVLKDQWKGSPMVDSFEQFEQGDKVGEVDPYVVRRARWIMIYGVLQVLAQISNDTPNLAWEGQDKVKYFLNPKLQGCPPWSTESFPEAHRSMSHVYKVWKTWSTEEEPAEDAIPARDSELPYRENFSSPPSVSGASNDDGNLWMVASPTLTNNSHSGYGYPHKQVHLVEPLARSPPNPPSRTDIRKDDILSRFPSPSINGSQPALQPRLDSRQEEFYDDFPTPTANGSRGNQQPRVEIRQDSHRDFSDPSQTRIDPQSPQNLLDSRAGSRTRMETLKEGKVTRPTLTLDLPEIPPWRPKQVQQLEQLPAQTEAYAHKPLPTLQPKAQQQYQEVQQYEEKQQYEEPSSPSIVYYDEEPSSPDDLVGYGQAPPPHKPKPRIVKQGTGPFVGPRLISARRKELMAEKERQERLEKERQQQQTQAQAAYHQEQPPQPQYSQQEQRTATPEWRRVNAETPEYARQHLVPENANSRTVTPHSQSQPLRQQRPMSPEEQYGPPLPAYQQNKRVGTPQHQQRPMSPEVGPPQAPYQQNQQFGTPQRQQRPQSPEEHAYGPPQPAYQQSQYAGTPQRQQRPQSPEEHVYNPPQPAYQQNRHVGTPQRQQRPQSPEEQVYHPPQPAYQPNPLPLRTTTPQGQPQAHYTQNFSYVAPQPAYVQQQRVATPPNQVRPLEEVFLSPQPLFSQGRTATPERSQYDSPQTVRRRENFDQSVRHQGSQKFPPPAAPLTFNDWDNPSTELP
ncbi:uncharacterized protein PAC_16504 [Phialocephala subalpina]|uniref:DUF8004 domain-containing protein n=1 Tax=Phialocephala subalpina TaxID=576137 RepID=A0A1L7XNJ7_9HELO|nr:uncharacterized protein PAC_16504 [Phialocephala subalpina]